MKKPDGRRFFTESREIDRSTRVFFKKSDASDTEISLVIIAFFVKKSGMHEKAGRKAMPDKPSQATHPFNPKMFRKEGSIT